MTLSRSIAIVVRFIGAESISCGRASKNANWLAKAIHSKAEKGKRNGKLYCSSHIHNAGQEEAGNVIAPRFSS